MSSQMSLKDRSEYERLDSEEKMLISQVGKSPVPITINRAEESKKILSALLVVFCVLIGDMARGILFPTLWLLVKSQGGGHFSQGCAISAFSGGRILSTPFFGYGSEKIGYRYVLMACNLIILVGCYVYSISNSITWTILGQFVIGIGAGSLGVTRSYVAESTVPKHRTLYMAYLTAVQYAGFTVTPIIGALISAWGAQIDIDLFGLLKLNKFSLPAMFLGLTALVCSLLMTVFFTEVRREPVLEQKSSVVSAAETTSPLLEQKQKRKSGSVQSSSDSTSSGQKRSHHGTFFPLDMPKSQQGSREGLKDLELQSLGSSDKGSVKSPAGVSGYQQQSSELGVQQQESGAVEGAGAEPTKIPARERTLFGCNLITVMSVAGCALNMATKGTIGVFETLGLMYVTTHYHWSSTSAGIFFSCCGAVGVVFLLSFSLLLRCAEDVDLVLYGLLVMLASCVIFASLLSASLPLWEFYIGIVMMYSIGYPIGHTALIGVFSKLIKSGPQGRLLGMFGSAGSLARVIFPLVAGLVTEFYGDKVIFLVLVVVLMLSCALFAWFKNTVSEIISD